VSDITGYFKAAQAFDEGYTQSFERLCRTTIDRDTVETQTSIDAAWSALRKFVGNKVLG